MVKKEKTLSRRVSEWNSTFNWALHQACSIQGLELGLRWLHDRAAETHLYESHIGKCPICGMVNCQYR